MALSITTAGGDELQAPKPPYRTKQSWKNTDCYVHQWSSSSTATRQISSKLGTFIWLSQETDTVEVGSLYTP
jgi:hypothetical protein